MVASQNRSATRRAGRAARHNLAGAERVEHEAALISHLLSLSLLEGRSVGLFVADDGEPDLTPIAELLWRRGQQVALPVVGDEPADRSMHFRSWSPDVDLVAGRYGIPVPPVAASKPMSPACVLVSLTAFDAMGNRMGRGGGYFDRYLASVDTAVVGVGFERQRMDRVPTESHDVSLPVIVTDLGVRFFT